jgi:putative Ca2+/H+ antiporter (TMEM165/GDT1 family)
MIILTILFLVIYTIGFVSFIAAILYAAVNEGLRKIAGFIIALFIVEGLCVTVVYIASRYP